MSKVVIVGAARTPIGRAGGTLADFSAVDLGAIAIRAALTRAYVPPDQVDNAIMGFVYGAGLGQAPHTQAARKAGLPWNVPSYHVEAVCASGLLAVIHAAHEVASPFAKKNLIVAGGMESMSNVPYAMSGKRPRRFLEEKTLAVWIREKNLEHIPPDELYRAIMLYDILQEDGLQDAYSMKSMGACMELCAQRYGFSRQDLDAWGQLSYRRALEAARKEFLKEEIVAIHCHDVIVADDEGPARNPSVQDFEKRKPAFGGMLTGLTVAQISDGAAAVIVASKKFAASRGLPILAEIVSIGSHARQAEEFPVAPAYAALDCLGRAKLLPKDVDLWECNEAGAPVTLAFAKKLGIPYQKLNICGGAIAQGHPIGASGAIRLVRLIHDLRRLGLRWGLVAICHGGGGALAMLVRNPSAP